MIAYLVGPEVSVCTNLRELADDQGGWHRVEFQNLSAARLKPILSRLRPLSVYTFSQLIFARTWARAHERPFATYMGELATERTNSDRANAVYSEKKRPIFEVIMKDGRIQEVKRVFFHDLKDFYTVQPGDFEPSGCCGSVGRKVNRFRDFQREF